MTPASRGRRTKYHTRFISCRVRGCVCELKGPKVPILIINVPMASRFPKLLRLRLFAPTSTPTPIPRGCQSPTEDHNTGVHQGLFTIHGEIPSPPGRSCHLPSKVKTSRMTTGHSTVFLMVLHCDFQQVGALPQPR